MASTLSVARTSACAKWASSFQSLRRLVTATHHPPTPHDDHQPHQQPDLTNPTHTHQRASIGAMARHWYERHQLPHPLAARLARRLLDAPLWAEPQALDRRVENLRQTLPFVPLETLMELAPALIQYSPRTISEKVAQLQLAVPAAGFAKLLRAAPKLLQRDVNKLVERARLLRLIGGDALVQRMADCPGLLSGSSDELQRRAEIVRRAFSERELDEMRSYRLARLLSTRTDRLPRLVYARAARPELHGGLGDKVVTNLSTQRFEKLFKPKPMNRFRLAQAQSAFAKMPRFPLQRSEVPVGKCNAFRVGAAKYDEWCKQLEEEERLDAAARRLPDPRGRTRAVPLTPDPEELVAERMRRPLPRGDVMRSILWRGPASASAEGHPVGRSGGTGNAQAVRT